MSHWLIIVRIAQISFFKSINKTFHKLLWHLSVLIGMSQSLDVFLFQFGEFQEIDNSLTQFIGGFDDISDILLSTIQNILLENCLCWHFG